MISRRGFLRTTGAATVGVAVGTQLGSAAAVRADGNRTRGADIVAAKPALRDAWSSARSAKVFGYGTPGPTWPKAEMVTFTAEADGETVGAWLPPPLEPTQPAKAMLFVARYPMTKLGFGYNEAAVFLHGAHEGREYLHCTWMVVDDDTAMILGREVLGFPKKMAVIDADIHAENPTARVQRKGLPVLEIAGGKPTPMEGGDGLLGLPVVNVIGTLRQKAELLQLGGEQKLHWGKGLDLEVSVGESDLDPLYRLGIQPRQQGTIVVVDMGVGGGQDGEAAEGNLTGTAVTPAWMMQAYPFRAW
jgi:acetoacetate decarboxylase